MRDVASKIEPLYGRIIVRPCEVAFDDEESRIVRPDISQDAPETGQVVAVAKDCRTIKVGDVVMFGKYSGYGMADDEFLNMREEDVHVRLHGVRVKFKDKDSKSESSLIVAQ